MHTIDLTDPELRVVQTSLRLYLDTLRAEHGDLLRTVKEVLAKLPEPAGDPPG